MRSKVSSASAGRQTTPDRNPRSSASGSRAATWPQPAPGLGSGAGSKARLPHGNREGTTDLFPLVSIVFLTWGRSIAVDISAPSTACRIVST